MILVLIFTLLYLSSSQQKKEGNQSMENQTYHIYDRIFKRLFSLSNLAIINLINGLFQTNYPPDSTVTYTNRDFVNRPLNERFADVLITIDGIHSYHLEAQRNKDDNIVLRVFEYGFYAAMENRQDDDCLTFPEPIVIYLSREKSIPPESCLTIDFGKQGTFQYKVQNYVYLDHDLREINQKKMIVLIPFQLLRLKDLIQKEPNRENFQQLQKLIQNDILGSVEANLKVGNITLQYVPRF